MERKEKELPTLLFFLRRCPTNNTVSPFSRERERGEERKQEIKPRDHPPRPWGHSSRGSQGGPSRLHESTRS